MAVNDLARTNNNMRYDAGSYQTVPSSLTQTVTASVRQNFSRMKTLVLKLKPTSRRPDLSSLSSEQLDNFVDEMMINLQDTFTRNINDLRSEIKSARPHPSDPNFSIKMQLYEELLSAMIPVVQQIHVFAGEILDELHELINQLWDDICKNNGQQVDRLLEEHAHHTEMSIKKTFLEPFDKLEKKLNEIRAI